MKYFALDFEGTHQNPRFGCAGQIGIALMEDGEVLASDEYLIRQPRHWKTGKALREVNANSLAVWGMTAERLEAEGLSPREACDRLRDWVAANAKANYPVVAYNASYDIETYRDLLYNGGWYDREVYEYQSYPEILCGPVQCVMSLARHQCAGRLTRWSLDEVADLFGLSRDTEVHGALMDAVLAGQIFQRLRLAKEAGQGAA